MQIDLAILISVISVVFGVVAGITNLRRNKSKDDKADATQNATLIVRLENIDKGITEIKSDFKTLKAETKENRERLIKVEESSKQAHHRLDKMENRG